jgi:hypothetical protein
MHQNNEDICSAPCFYHSVLSHHLQVTKFIMLSIVNAIDIFVHTKEVLSGCISWFETFEPHHIILTRTALHDKREPSTFFLHLVMTFQIFKLESRCKCHCDMVHHMLVLIKLK